MADTIMRSSTADPRLGDAYSVGFGANYKIGDVTPYLGFQLGRNETVWSWVGASSFLSGSYLAKHNVSGVVGQFDGWSTTVGALYIFPLSKKALVYAGGAYTAERMERSDAGIDHDTWHTAAGMALAF